ncbi:MAG: pyridoxamine 5'-phosphate oxidase family protein [Anaerovoracaceae bacterium]
MRRKDREISDFQEILKIVDACDVMRIGVNDGLYPYVVPVNFGYELDGQQLYLYIHGAMEGQKYVLLNKQPYCAFEMDIPLGIECIPEKGDVTMRYQSVMGRAVVDFLEGEEKQRVLDEVLMGRYEETKAFAYNKDAVKRTAVIRLKVTQITGKANLSE